MLDKLDAIKAKFDNLGVALTNPDIVSDNKKFSAMSKEYRSLGKIVDVRNAYVKLLDDIEFNKEVLHSDDEEMRNMAKFELPSNQEMQRLGIKNGIKVKELEGGKLRSAGIKEGFIITNIDRKSINNVDDIVNALDKKRGGILIEGYYPNGVRSYYGFGL